MNPKSSSPVDSAQSASQHALQQRLTLLRTLTVSQTWTLILLGVAWEMWLAPIRPGGSVLVLKVVPLVLIVSAFARHHLRSYQLWSMLILFYLCEGIVRGMSDPGLSARLAWIEVVLSTGIYACVLLYVRTRRLLAQLPPAA